MSYLVQYAGALVEDGFFGWTHDVAGAAHVVLDDEATRGQKIQAVTLASVSFLLSTTRGAKGKVSTASGLPLVKPNTPQWNSAVQKLSGLKKGKANIKVSTATEAKQLLKEARGNMNNYKQYSKDKGVSYKKGYETHNQQNAREIGAGNDLQHIKWKDGKSGGHIFYNKPN